MIVPFKGAVLSLFHNHSSLSRKLNQMKEGACELRGVATAGQRFDSSPWPKHINSAENMRGADGNSSFRITENKNKNSNTNVNELKPPSNPKTKHQL